MLHCKRLNMIIEEHVIYLKIDLGRLKLRIKFVNTLC